jgi:hypothetical protein
VGIHSPCVGLLGRRSFARLAVALAIRVMLQGWRFGTVEAELFGKVLIGRVEQIRRAVDAGRQARQGGEEGFQSKHDRYFPVREGEPGAAPRGGRVYPFPSNRFANLFTRGSVSFNSG